MVQNLWGRRIPLRDGVELSADILLPSATGAFPTLLMRTPYGRGRTLSNPNYWIRLVRRGYALVVVDLRGRNDSAGEWAPWARDTEDAVDTVEWVESQTWCDGKIGMLGGSYEGLTQWWTAAGRPSALKCIAPLCAGGFRHEVPFVGTGIPVQYRLWWSNLVLGRVQQYSGAPSWEAWIRETPLASLDERFGLGSSAWREYVTGIVDFGSGSGALTSAEFGEVDIPVLIGAGWWDNQETMLTWQALQASPSAPDCRLLIGAWDHAGNISPRPTLGGLDVAPTVMDTIAYVERFFATHLKGEAQGPSPEARCRVFLTGENTWENLEHWPGPDATDVSLFLTSGGDARGLYGDGRLVVQPPTSTGRDTYVYDPSKPARDMSNLDVFAWADPPLDHRYLQRRRDCLVYTSDQLSTSLKVSGRSEAKLVVSSDRPDTDFYVAISDVHPDGRAIGMAATNFASSCLRLRYRNGPTPELAQPHEAYEIAIPGPWLHHVFKPGHRIRLTVSSGNFPLMARNAGTGKHWAQDDVLVAQCNTIHHSPTAQSRIVLPVVPRDAQQCAF